MNNELIWLCNNVRPARMYKWAADKDDDKEEDDDDDVQMYAGFGPSTRKARKMSEEARLAYEIEKAKSLGSINAKVNYLNNGAARILYPTLGAGLGGLVGTIGGGALGYILGQNTDDFAAQSLGPFAGMALGGLLGTAAGGIGTHMAVRHRLDNMEG